MLNHKGSQTIETKRTIMRKFQLEDTDAMFKNWASDEQVTRFLTWKPHANRKVTQDVMETWCAHYHNNTYHWALVLKETNEPIGSIGIVRLYEEDSRGEFGYAISREHWNKGIVTEAMTALLDYFFNTIGFETIDGVHDVNNPASGRVMQKLGMAYSTRVNGEFKDNQNNPIDVFRYTINKEKLNKLSIRKAYAHEVDLVADLYDNLVSHLTKIEKNYAGWRVGIYPTRGIAQLGYDEGGLYVAQIGGKLAGTCILNCHQPQKYQEVSWSVKTEKPLIVHTLAVSHEFLGQGIAQKLLAFADELAIKEGHSSIRLDTSEQNLPARRLYEKVGYLRKGSVDLGLERSNISKWYVYEKIVG